MCFRKKADSEKTFAGRCWSLSCCDRHVREEDCVNLTRRGTHFSDLERCLSDFFHFNPIPLQLDFFGRIGYNANVHASLVFALSTLYFYLSILHNDISNPIIQSLIRRKARNLQRDNGEFTSDTLDWSGVFRRFVARH
ncbi:hypothetical protein TcasGA2_TC013345 [Tribolium castaneum]|uniref:Uncharacterized protein n=1 Tax=Tribolium castaneum TaxID=7070 RepID=D6WM45_TRICA|nr:hypothetical protein TcasGA2_TC013345 [Tribolium castaneum]